ncbi:hypothetical protein K505DRAFT_235476 [Melanomma pulvis-pyrius CBS 109.77]|uniref:Sld7 C-terminal domain-containing protein n=1 Tax=Melanomma pulvis-pyrius CBS 109.77 TaxID=1314802 RepID=A0A6A6XMR0_9PLEO|nr:hypothetical protein K505DRAFT_235476 [Melanomma pulvis-pyrius CBS 109.77]
MADIWSGDILLANNTTIKEISLASPNVAPSPTLPATALRFLSTVDTARIPLYLATGPSFDVWTTSEETEEWFQSILLRKVASATDASENAAVEDWWTWARAQSPIGILVQVEGGYTTLNSPRITELLFYGTVAAPAKGVLPTPPSSSPDLPHIQPGDLPELRVHALPLSSDLLYRANLPEFPPLSPAQSGAQFLPSLHSSDSTVPRSPKRKRDIFDEATQLQRKARRQGGEGVAAAAGKGRDSQPAIAHRKSLSVDTKIAPLSDTRPPSANGILPRPPSRQLSRSPSVSSDIRPLSRKGLPDGHAKRSGLSQVATVSLQSEEPTTETRNKEAITRVVMAAMRMYGLQQRKKNKSRQGSVAPGVDVSKQLSVGEAAEDTAKDEEFKLIYHQTYKGAVLALRKHISTKPLHTQPDRLRDVVEKLLAIFCVDPLTEPPLAEDPPDLLATPGSKQRFCIANSALHQASPFDMPSVTRVNAVKFTGDVQVHTGSPISRRREKEV